jgi:hypothetical protein
MGACLWDGNKGRGCKLLADAASDGRGAGTQKQQRAATLLHAASAPRRGRLGRALGTLPDAPWLQWRGRPARIISRDACRTRWSRAHVRRPLPRTLSPDGNGNRASGARKRQGDPVHVSPRSHLRGGVVGCLRAPLDRPVKERRAALFLCLPSSSSLAFAYKRRSGGSPRQKGGEAEETKQHRKERGTGETHPPIRPSAWSLVSGDSSFGSSYFP